MNDKNNYILDWKNNKIITWLRHIFTITTYNQTEKWWYWRGLNYLHRETFTKQFDKLHHYLVSYDSIINVTRMQPKCEIEINLLLITTTAWLLNLVEKESSKHPYTNKNIMLHKLSGQKKWVYRNTESEFLVVERRKMRHNFSNVRQESHAVVRSNIWSKLTYVCTKPAHRMHTLMQQRQRMLSSSVLRSKIVFRMQQAHDRAKFLCLFILLIRENSVNWWTGNHCRHTEISK